MAGASNSYRRRHHLNFLFEITKASYKLQNENSYLGVVWYLLGPLLLFGILLFVFSKRLGANVEHYPLYLLIGIISWNFFATATGRSMTVFLRNAGLLKALPIRLDLLVVSSVLHALISHVLEIVLFIGIALYFGVIPVLFPLYLLVLFLSLLFTLGVSFFLSSIFMFLRDIEQIWSVVTRAWWFATPIFYALTPTGPGTKISLFNPLYYSIHMSRELLIYERIPPMGLWLGLGSFSIIFLAIGYGIFTLLHTRFVDHL